MKFGTSGESNFMQSFCTDKTLILNFNIPTCPSHKSEAVPVEYYTSYADQQIVHSLIVPGLLL